MYICWVNKQWCRAVAEGHKEAVCRLSNCRYFGQECLFFFVDFFLLLIDSTLHSWNIGLLSQTLFIAWGNCLLHQYKHQLWFASSICLLRCCLRNCEWVLTWEIIPPADSMESLSHLPSSLQPSSASALHMAHAVSSSLPRDDPSTSTIATEETRSESEFLFLPDYLILSNCETGRLHHARYASVHDCLWAGSPLFTEPTLPPLAGSVTEICSVCLTKSVHLAIASSSGRICPHFSSAAAKVGTDHY